MASGRHGGFRAHELRDREAGLGIFRNEIGYSKKEYDCIRKGDERVPGRGRESCEYRNRVRPKDIKEKEVMNSGYRSTSSRSDSGSSGGAPRRCGFTLRSMDREPGELSSDGSDGAVDSAMQVQKETEIEMLGNGIQSSSMLNRKRKFSPIVWDRNNRRISQAVEIRNILAESNCIPDAYVQSSLADDDTHISEASPSKIEVLPDLSESHSETSLPQEELFVDNRAIDEDDVYVPPRTIISSRWANDAYSSADEGEIYDCEDNQKVKSSDERVRSSSRGSYHGSDGKDDRMEIDDDRSYTGINVIHSNAESEYDSGGDGIPEPVGPPQRSVNMRQGCRSVDEFERLNSIGEGTYGVVFRAKDKKTGEIVALKMVKMDNEREGFPMTSLREINILLSFHHPSIVDLKEVVVGSNLDSIYMVMEYMEHDLKKLMETMRQCLMLQLLQGVEYLHDNWVLHRDLKTSNLLLNNQGELKICDFGLARQYGSPLKPYTQLVVTLCYRAPELLLGAKQYSTAIDMWSLGCIMAELLSKEPLFNGNSEIEQLDKIFKILGTPNETIWPGFSKLPGHRVKFVKHKYNLLRKKFPATSFSGSPVLSDAGFDLLSKLLTYDPDKRITAEAALSHEWFREVPLPKSKEFMPTFPAQHAQDRRIRRVMKSPDPLDKQMWKELQERELGAGGLYSGFADIGMHL
ncbi:cyclin-dependent kinase g-2 [Phtheirospermum japonicum]|uniref:cyclin-dependent kinase n=1 Tax=Phtheirospermum japonicum TaxID=374723 RepID=A0A830D758_9LAMI|nr:cyclin-dependent kinase g-2 [Phtheirospermum japonicum]